ncbi:gamma carbonic anhydrase family protein [Limisphaera sp. VF-2]|jgi:carbonic anhydrase/acetyltransferase-like protein (isoleucine patch superfamily)|uniref:gamma carbonic anhydrase family protein n=1 Tax=Limisphaera sp. VF-2 TaxID=3400418 RepID=UPI00176E0C7E
MTEMPGRLESLSRTPRWLGPVYVAPSAVVLGEVILGEEVSLWPHTVLRADLNRIVVGRGTNLQDCCVLHLSEDRPCEVGSHVTVGHGAILHACRVEDECLIGMRATVLDGAVIGSQSIVGAGAVVKEGFQVPPGSLVVGVPARVVRSLTETERAGLRARALEYIELARAHAARGYLQLWNPPPVPLPSVA